MGAVRLNKGTEMERGTLILSIVSFFLGKVRVILLVGGVSTDQTSSVILAIFLMVVEDPEIVATASVLSVLRIQTVQALISIALVGPVLRGTQILMENNSC